MNVFRQVFLATTVMAMLCCTQGCQMLHPYRPVNVAVIDAETKQPIAGARVEVTSQEHHDAKDRTNPTGIAQVQAAAFRDSGSSVEVHIDGYFDEHQYLALDTIRSIQPAGWFERVDQRQPAVTIEVFAEPRPQVVLIAPADYRGVIKVETDIQPDVAVSGQREYRAMVSPTGEATVVGSGVLKHIGSPDYSVAFADGAPISRGATDTEVGYWWDKYENNQQWLFVGTKDDYAAFRVAEKQRDGGGRSQGKSSGGGRGGRRGGGRRGM